VSFTRLIIGNRFGTVLDELQADIDYFNWRKNNIGKSKFTIAANDPKATSSNLQFGNRVLYEPDNGLPLWGGVLETPRVWDDGKITCTAYSGEYLFKYRTTDKGRYFSGVTVGHIYNALITEANTVENTGVTVGEVWDGGEVHSPDYHFKSLFDIFQKSLTSRLSMADFYVVPALTSGTITFTAVLKESRGTDKTGVVLVQDKNLAPMKLKEQGPIITSWDIAGEGTGWGVERLTASAADTAAGNLYGLRESSKVFGDVSLQATLDEHAANYLAASASPVKLFVLAALDKKPAGFSEYDLGDVVSLLAPDYGFGGTDTTIRILAREFSPPSGVCTLIVKEQV
jgi:hypothetical protein